MLGVGLGALAAAVTALTYIIYALAIGTPIVVFFVYRCIKTHREDVLWLGISLGIVVSDITA